MLLDAICCFPKSTRNIGHGPEIFLLKHGLGMALKFSYKHGLERFQQPFESHSQLADYLDMDSVQPLA